MRKLQSAGGARDRPPLIIYTLYGEPEYTEAELMKAIDAYQQKHAKDPGILSWDGKAFQI